MDIWAKGKFTLIIDERLTTVVYDLLKQCLESEMSACPEHWSEKDVFHGTCAIVALLVQELYGGKILRASLEELPKYSHMRSHYWNRLPDGAEIDLTAGQFEGDDRDLVPEGKTTKKLPTGEEQLITREILLGFEPTRERYTMLCGAWNRKNYDLGLGLEIKL